MKVADLTLYNQKHKTLTAVKGDIKGIDDVDFSDVDDYKSALIQLKGKEFAFSGVFSDASESDKFDDYKNLQQDILMTIYHVEVVSETLEEAKIVVYLTYTQGTLASTLYNKSIPYGLSAIEKTIAL